jgi:hypothetical protein
MHTHHARVLREKIKFASKNITACPFGQTGKNTYLDKTCCNDDQASELVDENVILLKQ